MLRQEMDLAYGRWIFRPGAYLGVFDNDQDWDECKRRAHCNATHGSIAPRVVYDEETGGYALDSSDVAKRHQALEGMAQGRRHTVMDGAEHNNVYFPDFIKYKKTLPQCLMQSPEGEYLELHDPLILGGAGIPMPAIDDPTLLDLNARSLAEQARLLPHSQNVAAYVLGAEMLYPEYFNLGYGDFRPASLAHFAAWCRAQGIEEVPDVRQVNAHKGSYAWNLWYRYREQAMADRCARYYTAILAEDPNHLVYYPTHGSTLVDQSRWKLGQQPDTLASACDGLEMGHILIEDDQERRNAIMVAFYTAYGAPVIIPRLGNKQPDLSALGGGRSFTPETLRRLVYECLGLGIHTIFPIHWISRLHDGEWCIKDTAAEAACRQVFDEITQAAPILAGMGRMQPQVGLLAADATWIRRWNPRWTGVLQDALAHQALMTLVTDTLVAASLAEKMPVLVLVDCETMDRETLGRLRRYLDAGGSLVILGSFAQLDQQEAPIPQFLRDTILEHPRVVHQEHPALADPRTLRELFLSGPEHGIEGQAFDYQPLDFPALAASVEALAPHCVLRPATLAGEGDLSQVNLFPLTDRSTLLFVAINNAPAPAAFSLIPDRRLCPQADIVDALTGEVFPDQAMISLPANATRLLWLRPRVQRQEILDTIRRAEKAYLAWQADKYDTQSTRVCFAGMRSGPHFEKRYALAQTLLGTLALRPETRWDNGGLWVECRVVDAGQQPVSGAKVSLRLTPGTFHRYDLVERETGLYQVLIATEDLPLLYDANRTAYGPAKGPLRLIFAAESSQRGLAGGCAVALMESDQ